ncbi:MAG: serine/threonine protein kinase, partial [Planctomycetia bacterium]|nr:serine/threonine protein kinase [Planctomycetia bacterium]
MMATPDPATAAAPWGLDDHVDAFEQAQHETGAADLADFLPPPEHPLYLPVLRELVRVDLEYGWKRRQPRGLDDYRQRFPRLFDDPTSLRDVTFEEYRLRKQAGQAPTPDEYRERYGVDPGKWPGGASKTQTPPGAAAAMLGEAAQAYREFRLWQAADPEERAEFAAPPDDPAALLFSSLYASQPDAADQLAQALTQLPEVGSDFLGFRLLGELGRGAFGKVYLARQGDLADRLVALKVTSDLSGEWQTLAQLQHTHIVPIYSVHRAPPLQAVCMPYLGSATLADLLGTIARQKTLPASGQCLLTTLQECSSRLAPPPAHPRAPEDAGLPAGDLQPVHVLAQLKQLSFVQTVLWLAVRLTDGLAHAHGRGILHRDLKPANILLTDDGQPMLLDFNLAANAALRANPFAACVGGTLPYMAPEHLEAFSGLERDVDARSDLYAFGVILYEMLAGQPPFPRHAELPFSEMLQRMIADRQVVPPLRALNRAVPPALEAIVQRCLEPLPARRYQSAAELHEDLQRQLEDRPLRHAANPSWRERLGKWARRHPRLSSSSSVGAAALLLLVLLVGAPTWHQQRQQAAERARQSFDWFQAELRTAKLLLNTQAADLDKRQAGLAAGQRILERYPVADDPDWRNAPLVRQLPPERQAELSADLGEVLWLMARTLERQALQAPDGAAARREALRLNRAAETCFAPAAMPAALWRQRAQLYRDLGQPTEAAVAAE